MNTLKLFSDADCERMRIKKLFKRLENQKCLDTDQTDDDVKRKASTQQTPGLRLSSYGERERHNTDGHNFGVKIFQLCSVSSSL